MGVRRVRRGGLTAPGAGVALFLDSDGVLNQPVWDQRAAAPNSPLTPNRSCWRPVRRRSSARRAPVWWWWWSATNRRPPRGRRPAAGSTPSIGPVVSLLDATAPPSTLVPVPPPPAGDPPRPGRGLPCRKPAPGLLTQAARDLGLDLSPSWLIGDTDADVGAARAAGLAGVAVVANPLSAHRRVRSPQAADVVPDDLTTAFRHVLHARGRAAPTAGP